MKILVVCQHYYPEPFRVADICEELVAEGHEVTVVTGVPNYPMGKVYPGYENGKKMDEVLNGVKIHRCKIAPRKKGVINRVRNYFSFPRLSTRYIKTLGDAFDMVFVYQLSPVMMAKAGVWYKKKYNKKLILYCLDLWPESLCIGGIKKDSLVYNIFRNIAKKIYLAADEIFISSCSFRNYFNDMFGIDDAKIKYLPQYADNQFLKIKEKERQDTFHLLFAGNIGTAQSIDTIIDAAELLEDKKMMFHIVGDGVELDRLKSKAAPLSNVVFYGRKPIEEMLQYYEMADAMLVTLTADSVVSLTLPGKVQTYMAAGKPIVGAINGETALILNETQGGYCTEAGNAEALAASINALSQSGDGVEIGRKNREYYQNNFTKETFMQKLAQSFDKEIV